MFWAATAYAGGIVLAAVLWRPLAWWVVAAVVLLGACASFARTRTPLAAATALGGFLCLGALHQELHLSTQPPAPDLTRFTDGREVVVTGYVFRAGLPRAAPRMPGEGEERREVIDVRAEAIEGAFGRAEADFGIRVNVRSVLERGEAPRPAFSYGERLRFPARLREPRNYGNPGAMDYRAYLRSRDVAALASVPVEKFEKLPGERGSRWEKWRTRARAAVAQTMLNAAQPADGATLALTPQDTALLIAMVIGEQSLLERATRQDFQRTGVFHVLVVSGMNVGILAIFVFWTSRRLRAGRWTATLLTITVTLAYVFITDLDTPVLRAALMLCIYLVACLLFRDRYSLNAVGTAAWILLLATPQAVFEPSFQLTFLSMVALGGIVQPLLETTSVPYRQALRGLELTGYDLTLPSRLAQFRLDLRLIAAKLARLFGAATTGFAYSAVSWLLTRSLAAVLALYELLAVSVIMQLALALPMIFYFHRLALLGVPTNILVVPLTSFLMPVALAATLLQWVSATLAAPLWSLAALCLRGITLVVQSAAGMSFVEVRLPTPAITTALAATLLFGAGLFIARRGRWGAWGSVAAVTLGAALLMTPPSAQLERGVLEVTAIDVGQGDAMLLVTPEGKTLLLDAGGPAGPFRSDNFDHGEDVVSPYLWTRGINRLDAVAVTHAHSDHAGGMPAIIANFRPRELWLGDIADAESYTALLESALRYGVNVRRLAAGDSVHLGAVRFRVLNPPRGLVARTRRNEDSLVLEARFGETSALLAGDVEKRSELAIADAAERAALLKVAHHGSGTSTTPELLARTQPRYAVVSAGYRNLYGHPRADVLARLRQAGARTHRTDVQGIVTFYLDGKEIRPAPR